MVVCHKNMMPTETFAALGMDHLVYVRTLVVDGHSIHVIHAADGTPISIMSDRDAALAAITHYDFKPLSVH